MNKNPTKLIETLQEFIRPWNIKEKNMNNSTSYYSSDKKKSFY